MRIAFAQIELDMVAENESGPHPVDVLVGQRIRRRRRILGLSQDELGRTIGVAFQQIHKYETGSNRVSASRLFELATNLGVPVSYFFEGLNEAESGEPQDQPGWEERETALLLRYYARMPGAARQQLSRLMRDLKPRR